MENENKYNGWTNYATWQVKLELLDDCSVFEDEVLDADAVEQWVEEVLFCGENDKTVESYARAFLDEVNWHEIATAINEDNAEIKRYEAEHKVKGGEQ